MLETQLVCEEQESSSVSWTAWYTQTPASFLKYQEEIQQLTAELMSHSQQQSSLLFKNNNLSISRHTQDEPSPCTTYSIRVDASNHTVQTPSTVLFQPSNTQIVQPNPNIYTLPADSQFRKFLVEQPIVIVKQNLSESANIQTQTELVLDGTHLTLTSQHTQTDITTQTGKPDTKLPIVPKLKIEQNNQLIQTAMSSKDINALQSLPQRMRLLAEQVSSNMVVQLNKIRYFMETEGVLHSQTVDGIQQSLIKFTEVMRLAIDKRQSDNKLGYYVDRQERGMHLSDRPTQRLASPQRTDRSQPFSKQQVSYESPEQIMQKPYQNSPRIFQKLESFGSLPKSPATVNEIQQISTSLHSQSLHRLLSILNSLYQKLQQKNQQISHLRELTSRFQKQLIQEREHFEKERRVMEQQSNCQIKTLLFNISRYESITTELKCKIEELSVKQSPPITGERIDNLLMSNLNEEILILTEQLNRANREIEDKSDRINQLTTILYNQEALEKIQRNSYPATQVEIFRLIGEIRVLKTQLEKATQTNNILQYRMMEHQSCQRHLQLIRQLEYVIKNYDTIVVPNLQTKVTEYKKLYEIADDKIRKLESEYRKVTMEYHKMHQVYRQSPTKTYELKKIVMSPNKTLDTSRMRYRYSSDSCRLDEVIRRKQTSNTLFGLVFLLKLCDLAEALVKERNIRTLQTDSIYLLDFEPDQPKSMKLKLLEAGENQRKYLAPEIIEKKKGASESTIVWNIGILMDECLNRRNYFKTEREVVDALRIYRYESQEMPELKRLMESMLEKEATQRMSLGAVKAMAQLELDRYQRQKAKQYS